MSASATAEAATNAKNSLRRIFSSSPLVVAGYRTPILYGVRTNACDCSYPIYQFACPTPTSLRLAKTTERRDRDTSEPKCPSHRSGDIAEHSRRQSCSHRLGLLSGFEC